MARTIQRRSGKAGLPPGSLVYVGTEKAEKVRLSVMDYDGDRFEEREDVTVGECEAYRGKPTVTWINVAGLHDVDVVERLGACFGLHPLVLEDILNPDQRPKMEDHDDYLFVVFKMIYHGDEGEDSGEDGGEIMIEQTSLIVGPNYVISFQEREGDVFGAVRQRLAAGKGRIRRRGADYLAYALMDAVVDGYFAVMEKNAEWMEDLEEELMKNPGTETLAEIHSLKRDMIYLRKSISPLREIVSALERGGSRLVDDSTLVFFRDVHDHVIQVVDSIETNRDMLSGMLDIYLSSVSNRMNEVMKVLTIIATVFIPLTFIAGVYGMNFADMPELRWRWGYPAVLAVMAVVAVVMVVFFRRRRWL